jgi:hypothetical protein
MSLSLLTHNINRNLSLFFQSEAVVCLSFLDSLSPLFKECRLSAITPWWASIKGGWLRGAVIFKVESRTLHATLGKIPENR